MALREGGHVGGRREGVARQDDGLLVGPGYAKMDGGSSHVAVSPVGVLDRAAVAGPASVSGRGGKRGSSSSSR